MALHWFLPIGGGRRGLSTFLIELTFDFLQPALYLTNRAIVITTKIVQNTKIPIAIPNGKVFSVTPFSVSVS